MVHGAWCVMLLVRHVSMIYRELELNWEPGSSSSKRLRALNGPEQHTSLRAPYGNSTLLAVKEAAVLPVHRVVRRRARTVINLSTDRSAY